MTNNEESEHKKSKLLSRALKQSSKKSDSEVAPCLLAEVKRTSPLSASSGGKMKVSRSELQRIVEQEVSRVVTENETKLQDLAELIQQLDHGFDYESVIRRLEARVKLMTKRAEAAIAHTKKTEKKSSPLLLREVDVIRSDSEDEPIILSQTDGQSIDFKDKSSDVIQIMETTRKALKKMRADNRALTSAIEDLIDDLPPPVLTPYGSPELKKPDMIMKKQPNVDQGQEIKVEKLKALKETKAEQMKEECLSPSHGNNPKSSPSQQDELAYPPLPLTQFPSTLNMEAASFNIPLKVKVQLALIKHPGCLSVLWNTEEKDPSEAPIESYSILMTMEKVKGSGVLPDWSTLGVVRGQSLPMCVFITKYKPGHKVCIAVVGKDVYGRYGPYSEVVTAIIPE
ncbi:uncharacterized protein atf7ip2 isoform 1-T1 [Aulostomus maculatus]